MANRPKDKGTYAESAVVEFLQENGWPYAERRSLKGSLDKGDVTGCPGLVWEVKYAGSGIRMGGWIEETCTETVNAKADHGILVIKPSRLGTKRTGQWIAVMAAPDAQALLQKAPSDFSIAVSPHDTYNANRLQSDLTGMRKTEELSMVVRRPPGTLEKPEDWYYITLLSTITDILRVAGYGTELARAT